MPAPEPPRHRQSSRDGSAATGSASGHDPASIPAFLRETPRATRRADEPTDRPDRAHRASALPRPSTPRPPDPAGEGPILDPAALPMPSLSRRRVITAGGVILAGLLTLSFVRQVGEATAASDRAAELRGANAALRTEVERLEQDLDHVQDMRFIRLEARAFGLGGQGEVPFALAAGAPPLAADAPGSASVRLGAEPRPQHPIDAWLEVLFGAGR